MATEGKICMILGSAPLEGDCIPAGFSAEDCFVICADGGIDTARKLNIQPDLVVGDFDSAQGEPPEGVEVIRLPVEKDETDLLYAVKEAFRRGDRAVAHLLKHHEIPALVGQSGLGSGTQPGFGI